ncbi:shikimate dehydrogenase [Macrococcus equipercicus]|uniref:Shikimate dehydrogenase (NADP(+)) n=1 Tax=Macrococcus equipercicus TaxID=69967 RepID=A0A9Q9F2N0_9STAP|nr:shikimate dehydrogenase [Macrococcus equipercicus]UTH13004.1 shikimate dehydrogenase [Macrococcus equipercicus]
MNFAVIGHPVRHSLSPVMHHANFTAGSHEHSYTALDIAPAHFHHIRDIIKEQQLDGFNVTIPHKSAIMAYLDEVDEEARMMGAVNTVKITDGRWTGCNTDGSGFVESLGQNFSMTDFKRTKVLILGAGGASRAITYALQQAGAEVTVANRSLDRFSDWPFTVNAIQLAHVNEVIGTMDLIINTTPIGMTGFAAEELCDLNRANNTAHVADIIYTPAVTPFLAEAARHQLPVMNGLDMFVNQGAQSFEIWTGEPADRSVMKERVIQEL